MSSVPFERLDRSPDQLRPVVGRDDFDAIGQTLFQLRESRFHRRDRFRRILTPAHDDDAADDLAFAIELRNTAPHLWPNPNFGDV